ncbi:hypothetical protein ACE1TF_11945 [Geomicrobium sp. JSM 1781026]|uniref:hypothetical protein n=1 Tax=Geomicrobium sp. JSM 1781026 TaxID=3344580 RepID=UPI0035BF843E
MMKISEKLAIAIEELSVEAAMFFKRRGELKSTSEIQDMNAEEIEEYSAELILKKIEIEEYEELASRKRTLIGAGFADKAINMPSDGVGLFGSVFAVDFLPAEAIEEIRDTTHTYDNEETIRVAYAWADNGEHAAELLSDYTGTVGQVYADGTVDLPVF